MLNEKAIQGLLNTSAEKRYKSFLSRVADWQQIWLLEAEDGFATVDTEEYIQVMIWPHEEIAALFLSEGEKTIGIEVHRFLELCQSVEENVRFMVFPNDSDAIVVTAQQLCADIAEYLEEVE